MSRHSLFLKKGSQLLHLFGMKVIMFIDGILNKIMLRSNRCRQFRGDTDL